MLDEQIKRLSRPTIPLTVATLRRELFTNFFAYVDFTLRWNSLGDEFLSDDGIIGIVEAFHRYQEWELCTCQMPRGAGKTTIEAIGFTWLHWRHPWLQSILVSSVSDVTTDVHEFMAHMFREHPLIWECRPSSVSGQRKSIDIPYRRSKGVSFRARTTGKRVTGGRRHFCGQDDMEIDETVRSPTQRGRIRRTSSELHNLSFKGHWFNKTMNIGTPWDEKTILDDENADYVIKIPAYIQQKDGSMVYPYDRLNKEELDKLKLRLRDPHMFAQQYGLDSSGLAKSRPFQLEMFKFRSFETHQLQNLCAVLDPAGGRINQQERESIRMGKRRGDGLTIVVAGTLGKSLFIVDIYSETMLGMQYAKLVSDWQLKYRFYELYVEDNCSGWDTTMEMKFQQEGNDCIVVPFHTHQNKHQKIMTILRPLMQYDHVYFHERLRHYPKLVHPTESQFFQITRTETGENDDVPDCCTMAADQLKQFLYVPPGKTPDKKSELRKMHAPQIVIDNYDRMEGRSRRSDGVGDMAATTFEY